MAIIKIPLSLKASSQLASALTQAQSASERASALLSILLAQVDGPTDARLVAVHEDGVSVEVADGT